MNPLLAQFNSLSQLTLVRQLGFMLILAASIALGVATVLWSIGSSYAVLFTGLSNQDSANVITELQQSGIPYRIDNTSGNIMVPSNDMRQIRIQLANEGLPRSTGQGFDILSEDQSLGTSNFIEQARYNHALELELTRTITQIQGVRDARVHLSIPRQNSFIRNSRKSTASVMIDIAGAQHPGDTQLSGILHLVASSVAGLDPENVSIVDQRGNLLSDRKGSEFGNSSEAMRFTRRIEEDYGDRIIDLLTPIVGSGNVKAQVSANIDFTAIETTQEFYNPDTQVVRSEQVQEESADLNSNSATVEPGTVSPIPPVDPATTDDETQTTTDNNRQMRTSSMRNYEIDRSVSHTRTVPGAIDQLSVAVIVDLNANSLVAETGTDAAATEVAQVSPAEIQARIDRFTQLVKDAVGFNEARGDTVSVINEAFYVAAIPELIETPIWQEAWFISTLKQVGAGLVVLVLIIGVLRPALKSVVSNQSSPGRATAALPGGGQSEDFPEDQVHLSGNTPGSGVALASGGAAISYDDNLARAQTLVMQEPNRAARMIQHWLENE